MLIDASAIGSTASDATNDATSPAAAQNASLGSRNKPSSTTTRISPSPAFSSISRIRPVSMTEKSLYTLAEIPGGRLPRFSSRYFVTVLLTLSAPSVPTRYTASVTAGSFWNLTV